MFAACEAVRKPVARVAIRFYCGCVSDCRFGAEVKWVAASRVPMSIISR